MFARAWVYIATCERYVECGNIAVVEVPGDSYPTPADTARGKLRTDGWKITSRGNRRGWTAHCPQHRQ